MLTTRGGLPTSVKKTPTKEWAHVENVDREFTNFHELVPSMAREVRIYSAIARPIAK